MECPYNGPTGDACNECRARKQMPHTYCCLEVCGEETFCKDCEKGIYLKKENKNAKTK